MTDIGERYRQGAKSTGENYIGKGILLIVTVGILIFSLRPYKFCCRNKNDKNNNKTNNPNDKDSDDNDDKGLDLFDCNCVWTNPIGLTVMCVVLLFLLGTTLYIPDIPSLPKNLPFIQQIKQRFQGIFSSIGIGFSEFLKLVKTKIPELSKRSKFLVFALLAGLLFYYGLFILSYGIKTVVALFLVVGALALIYKYVKGSITSRILSLFVSLIFYVPCLLRDLFTYLHRELKLSTPIEWSILFVEIIVITLFFIIPKIYNAILDNESTILLKKPVYTNVKTSIENKSKAYKNIFNGEKNTDIENARPSSKSLIKKHQYKYGISLWLYLDAQPPNTSYAYEKFTRVFSYQRMPEILYRGSTNELKIVMQKDVMNGKTSTIYKTKDLPLQKWNHFVINYDAGTLDVFINNKLVISQKNVSPKIEYEDIEIGSENGVHGGICNVQYFDKVLSSREISFLYSSVKYKNPPVI